MSNLVILCFKKKIKKEIWFIVLMSINLVFMRLKVYILVLYIKILINKRMSKRVEFVSIKNLYANLGKGVYRIFLRVENIEIICNIRVFFFLDCWFLVFSDIEDFCFLFYKERRIDFSFL